MDSSLKVEKPYVVGIYIGGTNTVFGLVDARGTVVDVDKIKKRLRITLMQFAQVWKP